MFLLLPALLLATPALAQPKPPTTYDHAIAAGYKALTLCSGIFNAGRTQQQIEALELTGIYPEYDAIVPTLAATVERTSGYVTVPFDPALPALRAKWSADRGCSIQPIGTDYIQVVRNSKAPPAPAGADARPWPMGDTAAIAKGPAALTPVIARAFDRTSFGAASETTGVVVVRNAKIIAERYREGFGPYISQRTWSVAKSLSGTLVGVAALRHRVDVTMFARIPEWGPVIVDPRTRITLDHLLRMASGLHSPTAGNRTDAVYFGGTAVTEETVAWPLEAVPGTRFRYANNDILLAIRALRATLGDKDYADFPNVALFDKLGMTHTVAETDWRGNFILSSQVWSTARDLARFGLLYLNDGVWNGERLLPEDWIKYVTTPSGPQPADREFGYGATFWLLDNSPGVPADSYAAFGNRGQYVVIVPSRKIVIVRRGEDPVGKRFDIAKFTADVLAALQ